MTFAGSRGLAVTLANGNYSIRHFSFSNCAVVLSMIVLVVYASCNKYNYWNADADGPYPGTRAKPAKPRSAEILDGTPRASTKNCLKSCKHPASALFYSYTAGREPVHALGCAMKIPSTNFKTA